MADSRIISFLDNNKGKIGLIAFGLAAAGYGIGWEGVRSAESVHGHFTGGQHFGLNNQAYISAASILLAVAVLAFLGYCHSKYQTYKQTQDQEEFQNCKFRLGVTEDLE